MFVKATEKKRLPDFCFFGQSGIGVLAEPGGGGLQKSTRISTLEDQELATCDIIPGNREPKWKSWLKSFDLGELTSLSFGGSDMASDDDIVSEIAEIQK